MHTGIRQALSTMSRKHHRLFSAGLFSAALMLGVAHGPSALADASELEFRQRYSEGLVSVFYSGRLVRRYSGMASGSLVREFAPPPAPTGRPNRLFLVQISHGGNMCSDQMAVVDAGRSPPFASDLFGGCNPSIIVGRYDHLALSVRSDGSRPDEVWFYDGRTVRQLPRLSRAEHIRRAEQSLSANNKLEALRHFLAVADHGDARGPYGLARLLRAGDPVDRDDRLARDLLVRAAEMGHPASMVELAIMLNEGLGGPADTSEARRWFRLAADRGDGTGQLAYARMLNEGSGSNSNAQEALVWFRLAEATLAGRPEATQAREAAEALTANLDEAKVVEAAERIAAFRPAPQAPIWNLPEDWAVWDGRHPLNRVRGTTLFEMADYAALIRPLLGAATYNSLPSRTGPASIDMAGDWLIVSGCMAHACHRDQYFIALRRDGRDAAACVLTSEDVPGSNRLLGTLTYARMRAPRMQVEDSRNTGCPRELPALLAVARPPPGQSPLALDRDAPWPRVAAAPTPPARPAQPGPGQPAARPRGAPGQVIGSGTAWRIADGRFVTNAHVVEGCGNVRLSTGGQSRSAARVLVRDGALDLALLQSELTTASLLPLRSSPARPAEPVVVAGFPLQGVLATGPQVSTGIVTALAGLHDDDSRLQISAPIQPGNSGGPVLDREGRVIGVATSTIGTLAAAVATGAMPQNVNFAVKATRLSAFLAAANVIPPEDEGSRQLTTEDVASRAMAAVALVECVR